MKIKIKDVTEMKKQIINQKIGSTTLTPTIRIKTKSFWGKSHKMWKKSIQQIKTTKQIRSGLLQINTRTGTD